MESYTSEFDIVLEHLLKSGFPKEEALKLMVNMPESKRLAILGEEAADRARDERQARGGVDGNKSYSGSSGPKKLSNAELGIESGKTWVQKQMEKKSGGTMKSALDQVKANVRKKHGEGSIKDW